MSASFKIDRRKLINLNEFLSINFVVRGLSSNLNGEINS